MGIHGHNDNDTARRCLDFILGRRSRSFGVVEGGGRTHALTLPMMFDSE